MKYSLLIILAAGLLLLSGCGGGKTVTRLDPSSTQDLSGKWNDTDSRLVAEEMVSDCLSRAWLTSFAAEMGKKPVVTVGTIRNKSAEHIDVEVMTSDFERELINSASVRFIQSRDFRAEVRAERQEQQEFATAETMKAMRAELGADFLLQGAVKTVIDQEGNNRVVFYQTDWELINIETMEKVWVGSKEIKKGISQSGSKW